MPGMDNDIDIRALRERLQLSQEDLAQRIGVDRSTVSRLENGGRVRGPVRKLLAQLAESVPVEPAPVNSAAG
jgi:transcriptional regulator with XRE-family HTH domain